MSDLIDRQAVIDTVKDHIALIEKKYCEKYGDAPSECFEGYKLSHKHIVELINKLPKQSKIVMCKDCRYSEHWYGNRKRCFLWNEDGVSVFDDGFCNYGEKGEQNE